MFNKSNILTFFLEIVQESHFNTIFRIHSLISNNSLQPLNLESSFILYEIIHLFYYEQTYD